MSLKGVIQAVTKQRSVGDGSSSGSSPKKDSGDSSGGGLSDIVGAIKNAIKGGGGKKGGGGGGFYGSGVTSYHKGGTVRKSGLARLKKGEKVFTKRQYKRLRKSSGK